jgi:putative component of membrane protein insertase Oxa1/YidC/SpoIIIJ protein YidD
MTAFEKHGFFKGLFLSVWRLLRCNPWSRGGIDYVPGTDDYYRIKFESAKKETKQPNDENN